MGATIPDIIQRIRQNHALEHATMHLLTRDNPSLRLVGRSDWRGFVLYGQVDTKAVLSALHEGLNRLKGDQGGLSIHPRCGTNLAVGALITGGAAYLAATVGSSPRRMRFLRAVAATTVAIAVSRPLGLAAQRHLTTTTNLRGLYVRAVYCDDQRERAMHRIITVS